MEKLLKGMIYYMVCYLGFSILFSLLYLSKETIHIVPIYPESLAFWVYISLSTLALCIILLNRKTRLGEAVREDFIKIKPFVNSLDINHLKLMDYHVIHYRKGLEVGLIKIKEKVKKIYIDLKARNISSVFVFEDEKNQFFDRMKRSLTLPNSSSFIISKGRKFSESEEEEWKKEGFDLYHINLKEGFPEYSIDILSYINTYEEVEVFARKILLFSENSEISFREDTIKLLMACVFLVKSNPQEEKRTIEQVKRLIENASAAEIRQKIKISNTGFEILETMENRDDERILEFLHFAKRSLERVNCGLFQKGEKELNLDVFKSNPSICLIQAGEENSLEVELLLDLIYNYSKQVYDIVNRDHSIYINVMIEDLSLYQTMNALEEHLIAASVYKIFYLIGVQNTIAYEPKYKKEILENVGAKLFFSISNKRTEMILKGELQADDKKLEKLYTKLDTSKVLVLLNKEEYFVVTKYDFNVEKIKNYNIIKEENEFINNLANLDQKIDVKYVEEPVEKKELKLEVTKEEKEFISSLLKEKAEETAVVVEKKPEGHMLFNQLVDIKRGNG